MNRLAYAILAMTITSHARAADPPTDVLIADFENETYGGWKTTGEAFGPGPPRGALPGQMSVEGFKGKGLVNSFIKGDGSVGSLTSPPFKIERKHITFLIGGGKDPEKLRVDLLVNDRVVRTSTGPNDKPGGSEALAWESWDVTDLAGEPAVIRIVDQATGGWGHISVDQIIQTDRKPPMVLVNEKREFPIAKRYLNIPIRNGAPKRVVTTLVDGKAAVRNDIELADDQPDWWAFVDVSGWKGKTVTLQVDKLADDSHALESIGQSDSIRDANALYKEPLRGQFHFSSRRGWLNDPNGLVLFNEEYHLFYQHNPYGWAWGNMHWGHAVSKDLIHWEELGDALAPDSLGPMFSGSAVVDWKNTSGFGKDDKPPLVLIYTAAGDPTTQCIASSNDGRTFTKYQGNPVLKQITPGNRDPKVMWREPSKQWVMVLYVELKGKHTIHFLTSPNLRDWTLASVTANDTAGNRFLFECPDLFELPVNGDASRKKWVLTAADSEYAIGNFDGTKFTPEKSALPGQRGQGFYAPQTFSDLPWDDVRLQIGWLQTETRGMPFNQSMSIPLELKLTSTADGPRLTYNPYRELESLRAKSHDFHAVSLTPKSVNPLENVKAELIELVAEFEPGDAGDVTFNVRGAVIVYDAKKQELSINKHRVPAPLRDGKQRMRIFCDRTCLEVFASDGLAYVPFPYQPKRDDLSVGVRVTHGSVKFSDLQVYELESIWR